jgi:disulfide bond formation protein DsbB
MTLPRALSLAHHLFLLAMLAVIVLILTTAMVLQYVWGELPCPLCLLERVALFGVAFGIILNLRGPFDDRNTGISLIFALLLLVVSVRQTLLDIYPRPGHDYIGTAVLGLHMPVWSVVIALCVLLAFAVRLTLLGGDAHMRAHPAASFGFLARPAWLLGLAVLALCAVNAVSVGVQCGLGECHTTGYALLP